MGIDLVDGTERTRVSVQRCDPQTRTIGRKRISIPCTGDDDDRPSTSARKQHKMTSTSSNRLEMLPQEILILVLCKVDRSALKELLLVSKTIRNATRIAKESHFDVSTPTAKPNSVDPDEEGAPRAPKRASRVARLSSKLRGSITVALFTTPAEE